jgi:hypothetical protein
VDVIVAPVRTETFAVDSVDTETFTVTDEVVFLVVCKDLGWLEVTVDSLGTETFVGSETAPRRRWGIYIVMYSITYN